jgi:four helix bundle protein
VHDYRRLHVWQKSRALVADLYAATRGFPVDERFGLTQQLRRAPVSIPSNIAEGAGRGSPADFRRFIRIAFGSACEVETQLDIAVDLGFMTEGTHRPLLSELVGIKAKLAGLERSLSK